MRLVLFLGPSLRSADKLVLDLQGGHTGWWHLTGTRGVCREATETLSGRKHLWFQARRVSSEDKSPSAIPSFKKTAFSSRAKLFVC